MKKIIITIGVIILVAFGAFLVLSTPTNEEKAQSTGEISTENAISAVISFDNGDEIILELYPEIAPVTVENFVNLANDGFYDGLIFHRVIEGFMIQGGDPNGDGTGGSENDIIGEFSTNGHENNLSHVRGVISMARAMDPDSASSQFFIVHEDSDFLDGQYASFGKVIEGMDVVDSIATTEVNGEKPATDVVIKTITIK